MIDSYARKKTQRHCQTLCSVAVCTASVVRKNTGRGGCVAEQHCYYAAVKGVKMCAVLRRTSAPWRRDDIPRGVSRCLAPFRCTTWHNRTEYTQ